MEKLIAEKIIWHVLIEVVPTAEAGKLAVERLLASGRPLPDALEKVGYDVAEMIKKYPGDISKIGKHLRATQGKIECVCEMLENDISLEYIDDYLKNLDRSAAQDFTV